MMISNSFIFLDRINHTTEQNIWSQGILDWHSFINAETVKGISKLRKSYFSRQLNDAKKALFDYDSSYFASRMPSSEVWRLYDHFRDDCLFLDIETTGYYGDISVLGIYDGESTHTLVKHRNLDKHNLKNILSQGKLLVTFNGLSFDVPVIKRYFQDSFTSVPHLDLRFALSKLGYDGGLKKIESLLGISRCEEALCIGGVDAVSLWNDYCATGDQEALFHLVKYNEEDCVNLKPLADFAYQELFSDLKKRFCL